MSGLDLARQWGLADLAYFYTTSAADAQLEASTLTDGYLIRTTTSAADALVLVVKQPGQTAVTRYLLRERKRVAQRARRRLRDGLVWRLLESADRLDARSAAGRRRACQAAARSAAQSIAARTNAARRAKEQCAASCAAAASGRRICV